eukprot:NODE_96_length_2169_cov_54.838208_g73_i0.p1 GENE.NODE_96_length_2169_cov_54.838208_g73_i0~~NODE_96_length_2169_cov_54.838208_g73_i0.p1  ORF type:complete len:590 (+),score=144.50 NODE_96_length_2169_cov_54.838208_g73_i0:66-1835(+)
MPRRDSRSTRSSERSRSRSRSRSGSSRSGSRSGSRSSRSSRSRSRSRSSGDRSASGSRGRDRRSSRSGSIGEGSRRSRSRTPSDRAKGGSRRPSDNPPGRRESQAQRKPSRAERKPSHRPVEEEQPLFTGEVEDDPDEVLMLRAIEAGDADKIRRLVTRNRKTKFEFLSSKMSFSNQSGNFLCCAVFHKRRPIVEYLYDEGVDVVQRGGPNTIVEALFFAAEHDLAPMIFLLLAKGASPNSQRTSDGNTILHCYCSRKKPGNVPLKLLALKTIKPDIVNSDGLTALHLLAMNCESPREGREIARMFKLRGADLDAVTPEGRTATSLTRNFAIREALSLSAASRHRTLPMINEEDAVEMDDRPLDALPKIEPVVVLPANKHGRVTAIAARQHGTAAEAAENAAAAKILPEQLQAMTERLYSKYMKEQEEKARHIKIELDNKHSTTKREPLSNEEVQGMVQRMYYEQQKKSQKIAQELGDKYLSRPEEPEPLTTEQQRDFVARMYDESMERQRTAAEMVAQRLAADRRSGIRLTREEVALSAKRLHDESLQKSKELAQKLGDRYLGSPHKARSRSPFRLPAAASSPAASKG